MWVYHTQLSNSDLHSAFKLVANINLRSHQPFGDWAIPVKMIFCQNQVKKKRPLVLILYFESSIILIMMGK